jgi:response regulator of citrate/malate metabolism
MLCDIVLRNAKMSQDKEPGKRIREFIKQQKQPFSVNDVARGFNIRWTAARTILLELAVEREVMKTTKSCVFIPIEEDQGGH